MSDSRSQTPPKTESLQHPPANTGNASNPSPHDESLTPAEGSQLLNKKAEKYLREVASIEDVPDAQDQEKTGETLSDES